MNEQPDTVIDYDGNVWRYKDKLLHCDDGPAAEYADGHKEWWQHGRRHRDDGPAVTWADGSQFWYRHGLMHRIDGPACMLAIGISRWYINGNEVDSLVAFIHDNETVG